MNIYRFAAICCVTIVVSSFSFASTYSACGDPNCRWWRYGTITMVKEYGNKMRITNIKNTVPIEQYEHRSLEFLHNTILFDEYKRNGKYVACMNQFTINPPKGVLGYEKDIYKSNFSQTVTLKQFNDDDYHPEWEMIVKLKEKLKGKGYKSTDSQSYPIYLKMIQED